MPHSPCCYTSDQAWQLGLIVSQEICLVCGADFLRRRALFQP